jgi:menaquinol-cytochrome c reductase iron-sulfur subunit
MSEVPMQPEELSRREWMGRATITLGGVIGLTLAIPTLAALAPDVDPGEPAWTGMDENAWKQLQATETPVQIDIQMHSKDAYLTSDSPQSVWGVKVKDPKKFVRDRSDLFTAAGEKTLTYPVLNIGFALFSPICPHLGCYYDWKPMFKRFVCPCHGSQFDRSGAHLAGPAARGLDPLPVREQVGMAQCLWIRFSPTVASRIVVSYIA